MDGMTPEFTGMQNWTMYGSYNGLTTKQTMKIEIWRKTEELVQEAKELIMETIRDPKRADPDMITITSYKLKKSGLGQRLRFAWTMLTRGEAILKLTARG
jgi:hypothetical protein